MEPFYIRCLIVFIIAILSFPSFAKKKSEYGDIIKETPEYKKITRDKDKDKHKDKDRDRSDHHYHYHDPFYRPVYPAPYPRYSSPARSGGSGIPGNIYVGITIGDSEFDYDDIDDGDAAIFHFGYRPRDSRLGYEVSFYDSGDSDVTSLTGIEIEVETLNLALTVNSSSNNKSMLNFYGQGGIYFADTTLSGPSGSVSENSNGYLLAVGVEIMLNRHFGFRAEAYNLFDVEDFANDEDVSVFNLGGQLVF